MRKLFFILSTLPLLVNGQGDLKQELYKELKTQSKNNSLSLCINEELIEKTLNHCINNCYYNDVSDTLKIPYLGNITLKRISHNEYPVASGDSTVKNNGFSLKTKYKGYKVKGEVVGRDGLYNTLDYKKISKDIIKNYHNSKAHWELLSDKSNKNIVISYYILKTKLGYCVYTTFILL